MRCKKKNNNNNINFNNFQFISYNAANNSFTFQSVNHTIIATYTNSANKFSFTINSTGIGNQQQYQQCSNNYSFASTESFKLLGNYNDCSKQNYIKSQLSIAGLGDINLINYIEINKTNVWVSNNGLLGFNILP